MSVVSAPLDWIQAVSELRLPLKADQLLLDLMDRNNEEELTEKERNEMESLVEVSQALPLVRAEAIHLLRGVRRL